MNLKIKFSKEYPKLWGQDKAKLLEVRKIVFGSIHDDLVLYDTKAVDGTYYELPKTQLIQLTFRGNKGIPFCTIRRYTPEKYNYYKSLESRLFDVVRTFSESD